MGDGDNSPASIIHSVDEQPTGPTAGASGGVAAAAPSKRMNGKVRQSSNALSVQNLRRIFSPTYERKSNATPPPATGANATTTATAGTTTNSNNQQDSGATAGGQTPTSPRKKNVFSFIRACFVPTADEPPTVDPANILRQIRDCEPSYEPDDPLLPDPVPAVQGRHCLVLDLDETLVHSSFTPIPDPDFQIPLEMQGETHMVYVKKRPRVDHFLKSVCEHFEVIVFTASLALYANPVMDLLDPQGLVHGRLYREHCVFTSGCYVKDISKLGRDLKKTLIVDNSPLSYALQPENAVPISSFITDDNDRELDHTLEILLRALAVDDVRSLPRTQ